MAEAVTLYTRGDANAPDTRGESMVERHQRKIKAQKEAGAHSQLRMLMPDAGPAVRTLALDSCDWDVDRARTLIKRFREVKADEITEAKARVEAARKAAEEQEGGRDAKDGKGRGGKDDDNDSRGAASSGSDGSASGSGSGSESEDDRRRERKSRHKKEKSSKKSKSSKRRKEKSSKRKKDSDRDRDERKAKRSKKEKRDGPSRTAALTEQFGKYGIIRENDYESKRGDFQLWATEVKKMDIEIIPKWEERELFKTYIEDYNTGTLPHKKYYDYDSYERNRTIKEAKKGRKKTTERIAFDDEEDRRKEEIMRRNAEIEDRKKEAYNQLKFTTNKAQEMREQEMLRQQMNLAYRTGNMDEARKIQERLNPDEDPNKP